MAFQYDNRSLPRLTTYAQALDFWAHAKTWCGQTGEHDERKLDSDKRHTTIRKDRSGNICCKLHNTDVVTYHPDNSLTLCPWSSVSTDAFTNGLLGYSGLLTSFNSGYIVIGDRYYRAIDTLKLQDEGQYVLTSEPVPWVRKTVNRKVANGLLKQYDYKAFAAWVDMLVVQELTWARHNPHNHDIPAMLLDREKWPQLLVYYQPHYWSTGSDAEYINPTTTKNTVRAALYKAHPEVYDTETKPYLESWKEVNNWKANQYR